MEKIIFKLKVGNCKTLICQTKLKGVTIQMKALDEHILKCTPYIITEDKLLSYFYFYFLFFTIYSDEETWR